jgi:hypothetical protein
MACTLKSDGTAPWVYLVSGMVRGWLHPALLPWNRWRRVVKEHSVSLTLRCSTEDDKTAFITQVLCLRQVL